MSRRRYSDMVDDHDYEPRRRRSSGSRRRSRNDEEDFVHPDDLPYVVAEHQGAIVEIAELLKAHDSEIGIVLEALEEAGLIGAGGKRRSGLNSTGTSRERRTATPRTTRGSREEEGSPGFRRPARKFDRKEQPVKDQNDQADYIPKEEKEEVMNNRRFTLPELKLNPIAKGIHRNEVCNFNDFYLNKEGNFVRIDVVQVLHDLAHASSSVSYNKKKEAGNTFAGYGAEALIINDAYSTNFSLIEELDTAPEAVPMILKRLLKNTPDIDTFMYLQALDQVLTRKVNDLVLSLGINLIIQSFADDFDELKSILTAQYGGDLASDLSLTVVEMVERHTRIVIDFHRDLHEKDEEKLKVFPLMELAPVVYIESYASIIGFNDINQNAIYKLADDHRWNDVIRLVKNKVLTDMDADEFYVVTKDKKKFRFFTNSENVLCMKAA